MKYMLLKKRHLTLASVAIFVSVVLIILSTTLMSASRSRLLPIYSVDRSDNLVSLTFDAAWSAEDTDELIKILKKHKAKATTAGVCQGRGFPREGISSAKGHDCA